MILLLGTGYIGSQFIRELTMRDIAHTPLRRKDYSSYKVFRERLKFQKPQLVINCAAYTATGGVDNCEDDKSQTLQANLLLPAMLANACEMTGVPLMHLSTGCLYNGNNNGKGWSETDESHLSFNTQCGIYVGSKALAEEVVGQYQKTYICRVRLPFDEYDHPRNLLTKLQKFDSICDETQSLCHRGDLVRACLDLWQRRSPFGTYHMTNPGAIAYREICARMNGRLFNTREFKFISPEQFDQQLARTPKSRCVLSSKKLMDAGVTVPHVSDAIDSAIKNWKA